VRERTERHTGRAEDGKEPDVSWQRRAACQALDVELFFGPDGESPTAREAREAKARAVCASCPVRIQCLDYALENSIRYGIWGGLNAGDRTRERRRRSPRPHAA
jgi:WhiB family transcriptional regulator, redox-sensing transcriptional regulator